MPTSGGSGGRTTLIVVITVVVVALLCCAGGVVALIAGMNRTADEIAEALPTPSVAVPRTPEAWPPDGGIPPVFSDEEGETFNMRPGDTLVLSDNSGTIEITVTQFRTVTESCRSFAPAPQKGRFLIAEVRARVTKGTGSINPFYFQWRAADGSTVNGLVGAVYGCGDPLGAGNSLPTGSTRSGRVVFDVADTNGVMEYLHQFEIAGSWKP